MTLKNACEVAIWLEAEFRKMGVEYPHVQVVTHSVYTNGCAVNAWAPSGNDTIKKWARPRWEKVGKPYGPVSEPAWPAEWTTNGVLVRVIFAEDPRRSTADRLAEHKEAGSIR